MSTDRRTRVRWLAPLAVLVATAACASPAKEPDPAVRMESSVTAISDQLVRVAELRTDLRSIRTCIHAFREESDTTEGETIQKAAQVQEDRIGQALEQEFMLALANEIYVVDPEVTELQATEDAEEPASCAHTGASHVLLGSYVVRGEELELSVRLVDTDSRVIIAATRGLVPAPAFMEAAIEVQPERVAATPAPQQVVSTAPPPAAAVTPEPTSTTTRTVFKAPPEEPAVQAQAKQPSGVAEDFETWRLRKAHEVAPDEIPPLTPEPGKTEPSAPTEDFETWRKRKLEEEGQVVPAKQAETPGELARGAEPPLDSSFPWRNARLEALLGIPSAGPAPDGPKPLSSSYPWRTQKLSELLRVEK